jgi:hypothetical protein
MKVLVHQNLGAAHTHTVQDVEDIRKELNEVYRAGEFEVAKVSGASVICLAAAATRLPIVENTHSRVKETTNTGLIPIVRTGIRNFHYGALFNLIGPENPKLDTHHRLDIRIRTMDSCGHLSYVV